jgi:hypothetical protein
MERDHGRGRLPILVVFFALLALLLVPAAPAPAAAGYLRCRAACKRRLKACKERCKRSGARWKARRHCYKRCGRGYTACKRRCR